MEKHNLENDILLKPFIEWIDKYMTEMDGKQSSRDESRNI